MNLIVLFYALCARLLKSMNYSKQVDNVIQIPEFQMGKYTLPTSKCKVFSFYAESLFALNQLLFCEKSREKLYLFTYFLLCSDKNFASAKKLIPSNFIFPAIEW